MVPPIGPVYSVSQTRPTPITGNAVPTSSKSSSSLAHANFWDTYEHMCALQNEMPLQILKASLAVDAGSNLVINSDRLKSTDWDPLFAALKINKNLKSIQIHCNYLPPNEKNTLNSQTALTKGFARLKKPPAIRNRERTNKLCRSLRDCLSGTLSLVHLEIYNIPLSVKDCVQIGKGLRPNKTLRTLSLDSCLIGDEGLMAICQEMQSTSNLECLDLTTCHLTSLSAQTLADLIQSQAFKRHNDAWKDSLRYGRPDLDTMHGLRRLTLNRNPLLGDKGAEALAKALENDLWLKALDLQQCNITNKGAKEFLEKLSRNSCIYILDMRANDGVDKETMKQVMEQVVANGGIGGHKEFEWMEVLGGAEKGANKKISHTKKHFRPDFSNRASVKKRPTTAGTSLLNMNSTSAKAKRSKSAGSMGQNSNKNKSPERGIPWRTAARATKNNRATTASRQNEMNDKIMEKLIESFGSTEFMSTTSIGKRIQPRRDRSYEDFGGSDDFELKTKIRKEMQIGRKSGFPGKQDYEIRSSLEAMNSNSVKDLLVILQKEQETKSRLENMLIKLQEENTHLKSQISVMRSERGGERNFSKSEMLSRTLLDDEKALEIIEITLQKYQKFLDFLRNSGFGNLIEIGEANSGSIRPRFESYNPKSKEKQRISNNKSRSKSLFGDELSNVNKRPMSKLSSSKLKMSPKRVDNDELAEFNSRNRGLTPNPTHSSAVNLNGEINYNIDNLLSNALEITRSSRRLSVPLNELDHQPSNSINDKNNKNSSSPTSHQRQKYMDDLIESEDRSRSSGSNKLNKAKRNANNSLLQPLPPLQFQQATVVSHSTASTSPATTVVNAAANNAKPNNAKPSVTVRSSLSSSRKSEDHEKDELAILDVEDLSQILSDRDDEGEDQNGSLRRLNKPIVSIQSNENKKSKSKSSDFTSDEDDDDDDEY